MSAMHKAQRMMKAQGEWFNASYLQFSANLFLAKIIDVVKYGVHCMVPVGRHR